jgi:hypothetical protein
MSDDTEFEIAAHAPEPTPLWWKTIWIIWGSLLAVIVTLIDRNLLHGGLWLLAGLLAGTYAFRFLYPLWSWYEDHFAAPDWNGLAAAALNKRFDSEEFKTHSEKTLFAAALTIPAVCAMLHGVLLGPVVGALYSLSAEWDASALAGSIAGLLVVPPFVSLVLAIVIAVVMPFPVERTGRSKLACRMLMLVSPVFVFPAVLHCLKPVFRARQRVVRL